MLVGKVCKRDVITVRKGESIVATARRMREHHVGDLVVVDGEHNVPVAVLTDRDLVVGILAKDVEHLTKLEVGDVLTEQFLLLAREDEDVSDVLQVMQKKGVRRVPVVDRAGSLTGILTLDDILEVMASDLASVVSLVNRQRRHEQQRRS